MVAKFYNCTRDERYVQKIKASDQQGSTAYVEILTDQNNVVRPTIRITSGLLGQSVNYVWLKDFKRFYYIKNWTADHGYITLDLEVDVLMSFKKELMDSDVMIKRTENYITREGTWKFPNSAKPNYYLKDETMKFNAYENVRTIEFPSGFNKTTQSFFLAIAGTVNNE